MPQLFPLGEIPLSKLVLYAALAVLALIPSLTTAAVGPGAINVVNFGFEDATTGAPISVASGSVAWTEVSGVHTVTAIDGAFDSGPLEPGDVFAPELAQGAYVYACSFHPSMRGVLVVV